MFKAKAIVVITKLIGALPIEDSKFPKRPLKINIPDTPIVKTINEE
jgi:hypothetical protein